MISDRTTRASSNRCPGQPQARATSASFARPRPTLRRSGGRRSANASPPIISSPRVLAMRVWSREVCSLPLGCTP